LLMCHTQLLDLNLFSFSCIKLGVPTETQHFRSTSIPPCIRKSMRISFAIAQKWISSSNWV
jgi:hypothetical protein